ncbi:hypothetical protein NMP99_03055 [Glutamicibacter mishrai]|uniref:hypothetical protein n=1 Tax=Glutamicibacter mishrai TaxID=1775880 RepID=UPI0020CEC7EF|nr:hypothetical protein [Glutamicibacter mishrai]UTT40250.1 hypothetical protein NMP99_02765 [Glutamicibacter mishrai]UTT40301.1 hypothetical protein NMP99_03055 [Glutamicibacter mishrai]
MSAADELEDFYDKTVTVRTLVGSDSWGDQWTETTGVRCFLDETRTLVRDGAGAEVISETTLTGPPEYASLFTPGSEVILPTRTANVIKAGVADPGLLDLPAHVEVALT